MSKTIIPEDVDSPEPEPTERLPVLGGLPGPGVLPGSGGANPTEAGPPAVPPLTAASPPTREDLANPAGATDGGGRKGSAAPKVLAGCAVVGVLSTILCCCGGGALLHYAPEMMLSYFLEDHPLPGATTAAMPAVAAATRAQACASLAAGEQVSLSPDDLAVLALGSGGLDITVLRVTATGDRAALDLSVPNGDAPPRYFNLHTKGAFTLEKGWFTDMKLDEFVLSGHDWSSYVAAQQLATNANQSLANERAKNPDLGAVLDSVEHMAVEDGHFTARLRPDGEAKRLVCDMASLDPMAVPAPVPVE